tara:strand:+ start:3085 stop:3714 length:630 start_codon:yes stop_codon:yes gene_type:complete
MGWFLPALQVVGSLIQHNQNKKAINAAKALTPAERQYQSRMEKRSQQGDPQYNQKRNRAMSGIRNVAQEAQGQNIQQSMQMGLQNSVIAQELRLRTDTKTMKQISDTSIQMAQQNQQIKDQAQDNLDKFKLGRDERIRQLNLQQTQNTNNTIGNVLGGVGDMAVGIQNRNKPTINSFDGGYSVTRGGTTTLYSKRQDSQGNITYEPIDL